MADIQKTQLFKVFGIMGETGAILTVFVPEFNASGYTSMAYGEAIGLARKLGMRLCLVEMEATFVATGRVYVVPDGTKHNARSLSIDSEERIVEAGE